MAAAEGIGDIGATQGFGRFLEMVACVEERTATEEPDCLGYGRLEEAAEWRICCTVRWENLAEGKKGRKSPAVVSMLCKRIRWDITCW